MKREEYIKQLISDNDMNVKDFAKSVNIPYTTLLGMLKNGLGGAAVDNVIKVCKGLGITIEDLNNIESSNIQEPFIINSHEKNIIVNYRKMPEMHPAINAILGLSHEESLSE